MSDIVSRAAAFARKAHAGQSRKGVAKEPYVSHVEEVAAFVARHGGDEIAVAAAWLHDTVEDCGVAPGDLVRLFGAELAGVVAELTDDKTLPKDRRKELQIAHAPKKSERAALVKLGDKASNVRSVGRSRPEHWDLARCRAYLGWAEAVVAGLPQALPGARAEFAEAVRLTRAQLG
jgi:(p)ppGpp synthase/HD superfamily hydrolase